MLYGQDIYTEPDASGNTLGNLGPIAALAGTWKGQGRDRHPAADGASEDEFVEHYDLQPIDAQTNGPQLFYGLRYHTHIVKPGEVATLHDQVGYWLWEPAASAITLSLAIPRGQVVLASGPATADAKEFELTAQVGSEVHGILSNPFLDRSFRTLRFRILVMINDDGTWSYEEETVLAVSGIAEPFRHTDRNTLTRIAPPRSNPLAPLVTS